MWQKILNKYYGRSQQKSSTKMFLGCPYQQNGSVDKCFVNYYAKMVAILVPSKCVFESCYQNSKQLNSISTQLKVIKYC